ncbi:MAG: serine/threonine protein kinase [Hormoscilla sp. GM7CHS1pb]|nr:serine/threonine protein kinase [Hormoscilla sp. GM7CHS1pb]
MNSPIHPGSILSDRYRLVRELGHGGFGRTYLAEDTNRFRELCVLKQFAPKVQTPDALQKAEELFAREAGVLYQLQHPQIPRFRELFRVKNGNNEYVFLVQDYAEGENYRELLTARKSQGLRFNEAEVTQLLTQLLSVLEYIHARGVIHRDISPENLILRHVDRLPVLIDFGGVKQVAAKVSSGLNPKTANAPVTLLGKSGYAPKEQMQMGIVSPRSDLHALAATCLVLLTGKEPQSLMHPDSLQWNWHSQVNISPHLSALLDHMLAELPGDRPANARAVLEVLKQTPVPNPVTTKPLTPPPVTPATASRSPYTARNLTTTATVLNKFSLRKIFLVGFLLASIGGVGLWARNAWINTRTGGSELHQTLISPEEQLRQQRLRDRRLSLSIDNYFFIDLVNEQFYAQNPDLKGRQLTDKPSDAQFRAQWDAIADASLDQLETISDRARRQMVNYTQADLSSWQTTLDQYNISSLALNDLTDARFRHLFGFSPLDRFDNAVAFLKHPFSQVWQAIASDLVSTIPHSVEEIKFALNTSSKQVPGTLTPGTGKIFTASLGQSQRLQVDLQASPSGTRLSIYPQNSDLDPLLADSPKTSLSAILPETGIYQFVVVNNSREPIAYQLKIAAK